MEVAAGGMLELEARGLAEATDEGAPNGSANAPDWWRPSGENTTFYVRSKGNQDLGKSEGCAYLAYDDAKKVVYFYE